MSTRRCSLGEQCGDSQVEGQHRRGRVLSAPVHIAQGSKHAIHRIETHDHGSRPALSSYTERLSVFHAPGLQPTDRRYKHNIHIYLDCADI